MLGMLLTLLVLGIGGIVLVSVIFAVIGLAFGLVGFLLFKVLPLLAIGWVVLKLVGRSKARREISPADQKWLDS